MTDKRERGITDEEVEQEIERLRRSPFVKLAKQEEAIRYARRNLLYNLRNREKQGRRLHDMGWTPDMAEDSE